ncbi:MAG: type II secretion system minor pseudopilin GspH [Candidatus Contendobacter sp.]|nr:type II secretion system minor pseudopilin GspH [Candidatus Contendobacter sp.]
MSAARRLATGFTLLEIMVVLVLIGIITSFALLSVGGGPQEQLAEEAQRLAVLVELHQQEAILSGEPRGIRFSRTGYAILGLGENGKWRAPVAADTLIRHTLPEDVTLGLWVEGRPAELNASSEPQVLLLNSGEATEFVAVFGLAGERGLDAPLYRVAGDLLGRLTVGAVAR